MYFSTDSHTFFFAYNELQQGNILSYAYISLLIATGCCVQILNCSKVKFYCVLIFH